MHQWCSKVFPTFARVTVLGMSIVTLSLLPMDNAAGQGTRVGEADIIFHNGFVYTVDPSRSRAQAFAVRNGKFLRIGNQRRHEGAHRPGYQDRRSQRQDGHAGDRGWAYPPLARSPHEDGASRSRLMPHWKRSRPQSQSG